MRGALVLFVCMFATACGPTVTPAADVSSPSPSQETVASAARITPPPVTPPKAPVINLPAFACADAGGGTTGVANAITARVGQATGYDRFVLQFDGIVPTYTVKRQATPVFTTGASGQKITLSGTAGALVRVHSSTGATTFSGPTDFTHAEYLVLKEARLTEDFEGYVSWGLGLGSPACLRTFTLTDPPRLVVDFTTTPS